MGRFLAPAVFVFSCLCLPLSALGQPGAEAQLAVPGVGMAATPPPTASPVEYRIEFNRIEAIAGDVTLWQRDFPASPPESTSILGGFEHGGVLFYATRSDVFIADPRSGVVRRRERLPGTVSALEVRGEDVVATVGDVSEVIPWTAEYVIDVESHSWLPTGRVLDVIRFRTDADYIAASALTGETVTRNALDTALTVLESNPAPEVIARALATLGEVEQRDPTNPWITLWIARTAHASGDTGARDAALERILNIDPAYGMELLALASHIDKLDPARAEQAFERGLRAAGLRGYVPATASSLLNVVLWIGQLDETHTFDDLLRRGERIWRFAPFAEGATYFYSGLAEQLEADGRAADANVWRARAVAAAPWRMFGGPSDAAANAGLMLNLLIGGMAAALLAFLLRLFWRLSSGLRGAETRMQKVIVTRAWSRLELLGIIGLLAVSLWAGIECSRGVAAVGRMAAAPVAVASGFPAHPAVAPYWASLPQNDATRFMQAWSLHHAGRLSEAEAIYLTMSGPEALANRGAIAAALANPDSANALFAEALALNPRLQAAIRNTGAELTVGLDEPLLLSPRTAQWIQPPSNALLAAAWESDEVVRDPRAVINLFRAIEPENSTASQTLTAVFLGQLPTVLMLVLCVVGVFGSRTAGWAPRSPTAVFGWLAAFVVPGTSRIYSFFGPFVTAATLVWLLTWQSWSATDGLALNILDALATPGFDRWYGAIGQSADPTHALLARLAPWWWTPFALNFVLVLLAELAAPDDDGPIAWRRDSRTKAAAVRGRVYTS
jgi:tetratricopeptide (TPR) repeat protein